MGARWARKRDANEPEIMDALLNEGCAVIQENNIDLYVIPPLCSYLIPLEVKGERGKLTPFQLKLHSHLKTNYGFTIPVVRTIDEALEAVGLWEGNK